MGYTFSNERFSNDIYTHLQSNVLHFEGVEIDGTSLSITSGDLREGVSAQAVTFDFSMDSVAGSGSISGSDLWQFIAFASENDDGSGATTSPHTVSLTSPQGSVGVTAGQTSQFSGLTFHFDLSGATNCANVPFICVTASKGPSPSTDFTLTGVPDSSVFTVCQHVTCRGNKNSIVPFL